MFIFWGTKQTKKKLGYVADFCPICRKAEPLLISRIGVGEHLYGVSLGKGKLIGHEGVCQGCHTRLGVDAMTYESFAKKPGHDVEALARETFSRLREVRAQRFLLEQQLQSGQLAAEDREMLLKEPFDLYAGIVESHFTGNIQAGGRGGWGCLGTFVIAFLVVLIGNVCLKYSDDRESISTAFVWILGVGGLISLILMMMEPGRIFKRTMLPNLANALRPLNPTKNEIEDALGSLKRVGYKLGKKLKPEILWDEIKRG